MALEPAFSVSAASPSHYGYDPSGVPSANGYLWSFGGFSAYASPYSLTDQMANDELILGYDAADLTDEADLTDLSGQIYRRCAVRLRINGYNVGADHQYLLVYGLTLPQGFSNAAAQFFVGSEWVRSEAIDDPNETVALLLDAPGPGSLYVYMRLAGDTPYRALGLTGITGYII